MWNPEVLVDLLIENLGFDLYQPGRDTRLLLPNKVADPMTTDEIREEVKAYLGIK